MKLETILVHGSGRVHTPDTVASIIEPVYLCAVYKFHPHVDKETPHKLPFKYGREDNPTVVHLEEKIKLAEGGADALAFSSGLAAINTVLRTVIKPRKTVIIAPLDLYGSTVTVLKNFAWREQVKLILVPPGTSSLLDAICSFKPDPDTETLIVFFESISNPVLRVYDIEEISKCVRELFSNHIKNIYVIVDNTIATCVGVKPLELGANVSIYSASKYLGGHNDLIGGVAAFRDRDLAVQVWDERRLSGTIMDPLTAFLVDRGLKTLSIRMRKHEENARAVAEFLEDCPKVEEVIYPGLSNHPDYRIVVRYFRCTSGIVSFRVKGSQENALKVCMNTKLITPGVSFGGPESIITHPYTTTHRYLSEDEKGIVGVTPNLIRLSVGLEDVEDIIEDLDQALRSIP